MVLPLELPASPPEPQSAVARSRYYDWLACIGVNDVPGPRWQDALA